VWAEHIKLFTIRMANHTGYQSLTTTTTTMQGLSWVTITEADKRTEGFGVVEG